VIDEIIKLGASACFTTRSERATALFKSSRDLLRQRAREVTVSCLLR